MNSQKIYFRLFIFILILSWCLGFTLNVFSNGSGISLASVPVFNFLYSNVCHQDESKIILINNFNFLVCARCSGIYFGALVSAVFLLIFLKKKEIPLRIFLISCTLLFTDVIVNNFILDSYNKFSAFITGLFFGVVCLPVVINLLEDFVLPKVNRHVI